MNVEYFLNNQKYLDEWKITKENLYFNYNLINNTKFFHENDFNNHKNENDLNLEIYVKKYQNEWLKALDDWHKKVYLKNFKFPGVGHWQSS